VETIKKVDLENSKLIILFRTADRNEFSNLLLVCKKLRSRIFVPESRHWEAEFSPDNVHALQQAGFTFTAKLKPFLKTGTFSPLPSQPEIIIPDSLRKEFPNFYPFQLQGVSLLEKMNGVAILADEMGLGKTCQTLGYIKLHQEIKSVLIIPPSSIKINWKEEIFLTLSMPE